MSLVDNGNGGCMSPADIAAVTGNRNSGNGIFGSNDGGLFWVVLLFLFAMMGGNWGNGAFGGNNAPIVINPQPNNNDRGIQESFNQQAIMSALGDISSTQNANQIAAINAQNANQMAMLNTMNTNQMGLIGALNAGQMSLIQNTNTLAAGLQNCCCENKAGLADLKYTVATEACADRNAISNGVRDIIENQNAKAQMIMDKLCQQEIDSLKSQNVNLQNQLNMANLAASQTAQTSHLERYLNPAPVPAYIVQNPNFCASQVPYAG